MGGIPIIRLRAAGVVFRGYRSGRWKCGNLFPVLSVDFVVDLGRAATVSSRHQPPSPALPRACLESTPMLIRIGYELVFDVPTPTPIMFLLYMHPSRNASLRQG